jgi:DNA-binding winged helix-turn-helix (wHTH) protein/tetratricopeptide (TPR) repeat protein
VETRHARSPGPSDDRSADAAASRRFLWYFSGRFPATAKDMPAIGKPIYRFGEFELDPGERRLLAHGVAITLTPKVFDTLVLLVERAGHAVSKDELMQALWPRGFVDESNLTKHIWLIRKALGGEHESHCIETVPKLGYRFVAPVQRIERGSDGRGNDLPAAALSTAERPAVNDDAAGGGSSTRPDFESPERNVESLAATAIAPPAPTPATRRRAMGIAFAAAIVVASVTAAFLRREAPPAAHSGHGSAIAIVEFNNLSQNAKDAWLGPALDEMLATEMTAAGRLYVLPDELVRGAHADLAAPLAGGFAMQSLATLRRRLGADYVVSGGYFVSGPADAPHVRLDLALQDARSGAALATLARDAAVSDLPALVAEAGAGLRGHFGIDDTTSRTLQLVANAQPPTADVARRIGFALDALHRNDPARARDELLDAIAQAPAYAPAYSYLAQAWSALGYVAKAAAAADQAAAHAQGLPEEQRLQIDLQQQTTRNAWSKAADVARALIRLRPDSPDYRLRLIYASLPAQDFTGAMDALAELRKLPDAAGDPRVELAAADIDAGRDDVKSAAEHARQALKLAEARDAPGQIADAKMRLGTALFHLGSADEADAALREAIALYQRNGNPHGEASARETLGKNLASANHGDAAREEYQRAMSSYQSIGDLAGMTTAYSDLSRMLWISGDRDGAAAAARHVLELSRETGDAPMQKWGLQALATADSDESASDKVVEEYREVLALGERVGAASDDVWTLANYADVLRLRGDFDAAEETCRRGKETVRHIGDPQFAIVIVFTCAEVALDRGDVAGAEDGLAHAMALAKSANDLLMQPNIDMTIAQIEMGQHRWADARVRLERSADQFAKAEVNTGGADAEALLALCADALGDVAARDRAAAHAKELRRGITERLEVLVVDWALAVLRARSGDAAGIADLRAMADDAEERHWLGWALESRLAAVEALRDRHDPAAAALAAKVASTARAKGFGWVLARLGNERPSSQ